MPTSIIDSLSIYAGSIALAAAPAPLPAIIFTHLFVQILLYFIAPIDIAIVVRRHHRHRSSFVIAIGLSSHRHHIVHHRSPITHHAGPPPDIISRIVIVAHRRPPRAIIVRHLRLHQHCWHCIAFLSTLTALLPAIIIIAAFIAIIRCWHIQHHYRARALPALPPASFIYHPHIFFFFFFHRRQATPGIYLFIRLHIATSAAYQIYCNLFMLHLLLSLYPALQHSAVRQRQSFIIALPQFIAISRISIAAILPLH